MGEIETIRFTEHGIAWRVDIEPDYDAKPTDIDNMDDVTVEAWKRDEWRYVGVRLTPEIPGVSDDIHDSLWGCEWGDYPLADGTVTVVDAEYVCEIYPVPDMMANAMDEIALLRTRLNALNLDPTKIRGRSDQ